MVTQPMYAYIICSIGYVYICMHNEQFALIVDLSHVYLCMRAHENTAVQTPLRDAAASIIADPMALNTSVTETPPSYMNLALNPPHRVRGSSNASEDTRRLSADNEARSYQEPSHEPKIDYGRQVGGKKKL